MPGGIASKAKGRPCQRLRLWHEPGWGCGLPCCAPLNDAVNDSEAGVFRDRANQSMRLADALTVLASQKCELMQCGCSFYPFIPFRRLQGRPVMFYFQKIKVTLSVLWITAATTMTLASAQEAALSEVERQGLAACLVKCPDGDRACINRCISKSQTGGVVWSDGARACIRGCRTEYPLSQIAAQKAADEIFGCIAGCLDQMVR